MIATERKVLNIYLCIIVLFSIFTLCTPLNSYAKVSGVCSNCHTMHNSQNGSAMTRDDSGNLTATPRDTLLIYSCIGCHSTTDPAIAQHPVTDAPIVYNINGAPTYGAGSLGLAGGNFYWVAQGSDAKGHNIFTEDSNLTEAPGKWTGCNGAGSCHMNLSEAIPPASFGFSHVRQGCTKCHMIASDPPQGYHHRDDTGPLIDSFSEGWYRFLTGHNTDEGVTGIEDADWQYTFGSNDHNEYLGSSGNKSAPAGFSALGNTMTAYCCGCHGEFHIQDTTVVGASPWLRHPSDAVLPVSGEYSAYTTYDPVTPVARPSLSGWSGPSNTVTPGTDMVMCLSCHKPHGSDYPDLLRWDYADMIAGDDTKSGGCFNCHTQKNQTP